MISTLSVCRSCAASHLVELSAEISIHFPGLKGLDVEPILAFPKLNVCLCCGSIQSQLSTKELDRVKEGAARFEAVSEARP
jgi:hypothetical protein